MFDYRAALVRVVDGDSIVVTCDTGFGGRQEEEIRLLNVSAPERREPGGADCFAFVTVWMQHLSAARWPLHVVTVPNTSSEPAERRTFVRYLATVWDMTDRERCLNVDLAGFLTAHPEWGHGI